MRRLCAITLFILLALTALPSHAVNRVTFYTSWDDSFFYAAFDVQDPDIRGANSTFMSQPWLDDCVEVFLHTGKDSDTPTADTYAMCVSAGGGSSWLVGGSGKMTPRPIYTFKYAAKIAGTLNNPGDHDMGYTVELAIPWREIGGPPSPGQIMRMNVLCRSKGEAGGFVSISPDVQTEADLSSPSKWIKVKFINYPTIVAMQDGAIICRRVAGKAPLIDGNLSAGEWNRDVSHQMVKPEPAKEAIEHPRAAIEKLALATYYINYQGDAKKDLPATGVVSKTGASLLTNHPVEGTGPWFSYDNVKWHKENIAGAREAGIDVLLPVCKGGPETGRAVSAMVSAFQEIKGEGAGYPLTGMFLDTTAFIPATAEKPSLKDDSAKAAFYSIIRNFFRAVPDEYKATLQSPADGNTAKANIVVLGSAAAFSDFDQSFVEYCNKRFALDFEGRRLIWIGDIGYQSKSVVLDGYYTKSVAGELTLNNNGWLSVAGISPGYCNRALGSKSPIRPRSGGDTFKKDWDTLAAKTCDWVIVESWNNYTEGTEIAPSMEYGRRYQSLTRINMLRFNGMKEYNAKYLRHDTPSVMPPGAICQVTLTIKNAGTQPWYAEDGIFLAARWYKDGALYADTGARLPLQEDIMAGQIWNKVLGIRTIEADGKPLPPGKYELRCEMLGTQADWFAGGGDMPLCIPVIIGRTEPGFTVIDTNLPPTLKAGASYNITARLRNDGPTPWKTGSMAVSLVFNKTVEEAEGGATGSGGAFAALSFPEDVEPGRIAEITIPVTIPSGAPSLVAGLRITEGGKTVLPPTNNLQSVRVVPEDAGQKFIVHDLPQKVQAGGYYGADLVLENAGTSDWKRSECSVGCHWYNLDGSEARWDDGRRTPLPADVAPGKRVLVKAPFVAPQTGGLYYLVWDFVSNGKWAGALPGIRSGDTLVVPVKVTGGPHLPVDLSKYFDTDMANYAAESLPPFITSFTPADMWPSGLWEGPLDGTSFMYPGKEYGAKNAAACKGQTVNIPSGRYSKVHILALPEEDATGEFVLLGGGKKLVKKVDFSSWKGAPKHGESVALSCPRRTGQACNIFRYTIDADASVELSDIVLPTAPAAKIIAITLEKAK